MLVTFTVICTPNDRFHYWLVRKRNELFESVKGLLALGAIILTIGVVLWLGWWVLSSIGKGLSSIGKYQGQTAEEWYYDFANAEDKYRELHNCVEPYATANGYVSADDLYYECF